MFRKTITIRAMDDEGIESRPLLDLENLEHRIFIKCIRCESIDRFRWNRNEQSMLQECAGFCDVFANFCLHGDLGRFSRLRKNSTYYYLSKIPIFFSLDNLPKS